MSIHDDISRRTQELRATHGVMTANRMARREAVLRLLEEAENDGPRTAIKKLVAAIRLAENL